MFGSDDATLLDGVIAQLTRECGGHVHEKGAVEITASSCRDGVEAKNAANLWTNSCFSSKDEPNSWICYDFKGQSVTVTSYSIRSRCADAPKSWVVEVSNDKGNNSWRVIDHQENNNDLADGDVHNFSIRSVPPEGFRFIRLRQIGKNHSESDRLCLSALEIFGTQSVRGITPGQTPREFIYEPNRPFNGLIAYLTQACGGNVHDNGIIEITSKHSLHIDPDYSRLRSSKLPVPPKEVANFSTNAEFRTRNVPGAWICYDFKRMHVAITGYSIRKRNKFTFCEPRWVLEGSIDGSNGSWEVIDGQCICNDDIDTHHFQILDGPRQCFRFVRLRQTEVNPSSEGLHLAALEIFGTLCCPQTVNK